MYKASNMQILLYAQYTAHLFDLVFTENRLSAFCSENCIKGFI